MAREEKPTGQPTVIGVRVAELRRLQACERALAEAYDDLARRGHQGPRILHFANRHRQHAALLAERLAELGGTPATNADDQWVTGPRDELSTFVLAEHTAARVYHDHLLDLDPESLRLVRERILPEQEQMLAELTGERELPRE